MRSLVLSLLGIFIGGSPAFAQLVRQAPTTLTLPTELTSTSGYVLENALGSLAFSQPLAVTSPVGETGRLFVVEKTGAIQVVDLNAATPTKSTFFTVGSVMAAGDSFFSSGECGLLGLAFHPNYASNRTFFVFYSFSRGGVIHQRIARVQASATNPNVADPSTHAPLITQLDNASNHNGGDLHFGPDGYLYASVGDEGGANDTYDNSRWIDRDFFAGILRLDVDRQPGSFEPNAHPAVDLDPGTGLARYAIPPDNPFRPGAPDAIANPIGAGAFGGGAINPAKIRTEFWAVALRNPWRFSFDAPTGLLFCADVGQDAREEINLVTRGGNFGWAYREANLAGPRGNPPAAPGSPRLDPIHSYERTVGRSITGGRVYRGSRLPELVGKYIFADYASGRVFALSAPTSSGGAWTRATLINSGAVIVGFGVDPRDGDLLLANIGNGQILRLKPNVVNTPIPATLSATGAFANLAALTPAPGVVPYAINQPFWSDHALKRRWFAIPGASATATFAAEGAWTFPTGTVWVKHFDLETTRGDPTTARRLETRFIVKTSGGIYGLTYRWRADHTDADLVPDGGADEDITITDGGATLTQRWRYPSRSECLQCHTPQGGLAMSFNTRQLNRPRTDGDVTANQILALASAGYLSGAPSDAGTLAAHPALNDTGASLESRVRAYLAVNCNSCHVPGGAGLGNFDVRPELTLAQSGLLTGSLVDNLGDPTNKLIAPGDTARSVLLKRIAGDGTARMPPLATNVRNLQAEALLSDYIASLSPANTPPAVDAGPDQAVVFPSSVSLSASASDDGQPNGTLTYAWTKLSGPGTATFSTANAAATQVDFSAAGVYVLRCTVSDSALTASDDVQVTATAPGLPAGWTAADLGAPPQAGSTNFDGVVWSLKGSGDIFNAADLGHFAGLSLSGNFRLTAKLLSLEQRDASSKAGLMIRAGRDAGAINAFALALPTNGLRLQTRAATGASTVSFTGPTSVAPLWLRLERTGTLIVASQSVNGTDWTTYARTALDLPDAVEAGLATSSRSSTLGEARFSDVTVETLSPTSGPQPGLRAEFFDYTSALSVIPDLSTATPTLTRLDSTINYASTNGVWRGLPAAMGDTFASRHRGILRIATAGTYTFHLSSDDGSRLLIDGALVINNDGLHGMREISRTLTLAAGDHDLRVEFFENLGGAGLQLRWTPPGDTKKIVPLNVLFHE
jgi:uncharacterized repeat protein (TIGR03806 family)